MHPDYDVQTSINAQCAILAKKFKEIKVVEANERELSKLLPLLLDYSYQRDHKKVDTFSVYGPIEYFILRNKFRLARILIEVCFGWQRPVDQYPLSASFAQYGSDPLRWNFELAKPSDRIRLCSLKDELKYEYGDPNFDDFWKAWCKKHSEVDLCAEARHGSGGRGQSAALEYDQWSMLNSLCWLAILFERYLDAEECLFRIKFILSRGEPPSHFMEHPRIKHMVPMMQTYDYWLRARLESDERKRTQLAWMAIYWLIETQLRTANTQHYGVSLWFDNFCGIIADFDLLGPDQDEFLRHFHYEAQGSCITTFNKMKARGFKSVTPEELGLPTVRECKEIYDSIAAEYARKGEKGGKKK